MIRSFDVSQPIPPLNQSHWSSIALVCIAVVTKHLLPHTFLDGKMQERDQNLSDNVVALADRLGYQKDEFEAWVRMF